MLDVDARVPGENACHAVVFVLIDHKHADARVLLPRERVQEALELLDTAHRRDDEVERRKFPRHGP